MGTVGGSTAIATAATMVAPIYPGVLAGNSLSSNVSYFRVQHSSPATNNIYGGRHVFSVSQNLTGQVLCFAFGTSLAISRITNIPAAATTAAGFMFALFDGAGNYRRWVIGGADQERYPAPETSTTPTLNATIDPAHTATMQGQSASPIDLTNITAFEIHYQASAVAISDMRCSSIYKLSKTTGLTLSGSTARLVDFFTYQAANSQLFALNALSANNIALGCSLTLAANDFDLPLGAISFEPSANFSSKNVRFHVDALTLNLNTPASQTATFTDALIRSSGSFNISNSFGSGAANTYTNVLFARPASKVLAANETFNGSTIKSFGSCTVNGASLSNSTLDTGSSNPSVIIAALGTNKDFVITNLSGAIRIDLAAGDYSSWTSTLDAGQTVDMNGGGGIYDLTGLTGGTSGDPVVFDATDGGSYTIQIESGLFATVASPLTSGSITLEAPTTAIEVSGIPEVTGAILAVVDLSDNSVAYPALTAGGATVPTDPLKNYRLIAKAPGYARSAVTLAGTGGTFEFDLVDNTAYYNAAASTAEITIDYDTYEITVGDGVGTLTFEIIFSTLEDLFSTEDGVLIEGQPEPVVVSSRRYLIFPLVGGSPSTAVIKPDPTNTTDPIIADCVLAKLGETEETWGLFDFSGAGGRILRIQSESVYATVEGSSLSPTQATWLENLHDTLDTPGVFSTAALANSPASTLDAQSVADALKLAPSAGSVATGSAYQLLNILDTNVDSLIVGVNVATVGGNLVSDAFDPEVDEVIVGTNNDKAGYSLSSASIQAVWEYSARTLSGFGSLVADTVTGVWTAATRALTDKTGFALTTDERTAIAAATEAAIVDDIPTAETIAGQVNTALSDDFTTLSTAIGAIPINPLLATDYTAPDNTAIADIQKVVRADERIRDGSYQKLEAGTETVLVDKVVTKSGTDIDLTEAE